MIDMNNVLLDQDWWDNADDIFEKQTNKQTNKQTKKQTKTNQPNKQPNKQTNKTTSVFSENNYRNLEICVL